MALNVILSVKKKFGNKYGQIILCCDDKNYWRKDIFPYYKAHRGQAKEDSSFDWGSFYASMDKIKIEIKEVFPYLMIQVPRCEADDVIGTLAYEATEPTLIYSRDLDFVACMANPLVKLYCSDKKKLYEELLAHEVEFYLHEKICNGDGGDGIPNIWSPGNSFVDKIRQKPCKSDRVARIYKEGPSVFGEDVKNRYEENSRLIDLTRVPEEYKIQIRAALKEPILGSQGKIFKYLTSKELNALSRSFLKDIGDF